MAHEHLMPLLESEASFRILPVAPVLYELWCVLRVAFIAAEVPLYVRRVDIAFVIGV